VAADSTAPDTGQVIETSAVLRDAKEPHPKHFVGIVDALSWNAVPLTDLA
jgi:hypothetical protein